MATQQCDRDFPAQAEGPVETREVLVVAMPAVFRTPRDLKGALIARLGLAGEALYLFCAATVAIACSGLLAALLAQPLLFPSLGPTAYLFFERPHNPLASPRNTIIGHGVGIAVGYAALALCGLLHAPGALQAGMTPARIVATTLAVAATGALLLLLRAAHPPAGATTLIVSLGVLPTPRDLVALAGGVLLLTLVSWTINRACGARPPLWRVPEPTADK